MADDSTADSTNRSEELAALMQRYQNADSDAATLLIARLSPQIFHFYLGQVRDRSHAEDLLQDFWLRIHHARATYRPSEPLLPWVYAIARRVQVDDYRRRSKVKRHEFPSEKLPEVRSKANESPASFELADVLKVLPDSQREAILLLKVAGLSLEEAARATGTTVGAVKQKAHRAYGALRKLLGGEP